VGLGFPGNELVAGSRLQSRPWKVGGRFSVSRSPLGSKRSPVQCYLIDPGRSLPLLIFHGFDARRTSLPPAQITRLAWTGAGDISNFEIKASWQKPLEGYTRRMHGPVPWRVHPILGLRFAWRSETDGAHQFCSLIQIFLDGTQHLLKNACCAAIQLPNLCGNLFRFIQQETDCGRLSWRVSQYIHVPTLRFFGYELRVACDDSASLRNKTGSVGPANDGFSEISESA
jgi:hypothetical protein